MLLHSNTSLNIFSESSDIIAEHFSLYSNTVTVELPHSYGLTVTLKFDGNTNEKQLLFESSLYLSLDDVLDSNDYMVCTDRWKIYLFTII